MPYITTENRKKYDVQINQLIDQIASNNATDGDLNYIITKLLHSAFNLKDPKYTRINTAIGVLECCKQELYRKIAAPYEIEKCITNGDV